MAGYTMAKIRVRKETNKLFVDFRFQGQRFREQTMLDDNAKNRKQLEAFVQKIEATILLGQFDYEAFFPGSNNIKKLKGGSMNFFAAVVSLINNTLVKFIIILLSLAHQGIHRHCYAVLLPHNGNISPVHQPKHCSSEQQLQ